MKKLVSAAVFAVIITACIYIAVTLVAALHQVAWGAVTMKVECQK